MIYHLPVLFRVAQINALETIGGQKSSVADLPIVFRSNGQRIGEVVHSYDPDAKVPFPTGFKHDLALIKLESGPFKMDIGGDPADQFTFSCDPLSLHYNRLLRLLSPVSTKVDGGRLLGAEWGATIGKVIIRRRKDIDQLPDAAGEIMEEQFSRSYLWRTHGFFRSLGSVVAPLWR